jgi:uncharacterized protein YjdB
VTLVGWNDNVPASAFDNGSGIIPKGNGAFLVQNSWGANWGDGGGFFWLSYYDPSIGSSSYFSLNNTADSNYIYYYDDVGYAGAYYYNLSWYSGSHIDYMANVFTVGQGSAANAINAVAIYSPLPGTQYSISVYANPPRGNPSGGTPLKIGDGGATSLAYTATFAGYNTAYFSSAQHLNAGDTFAVVVRVLNNNRNDSALTCEGVMYSYGAGSDYVSISEGQSYYSSDGKDWDDLAQTYAAVDSGLGNFNIRAYCTGVDIRSVAFSPNYPVKRQYRVGEAFGYNVGRLQVTYANGARNTVALSNSNVRVSGFDSRRPGTRSIRVDFMGKSLTYSVSVVDWSLVTGVSGIKGAPAAFNYSAGAKSNYIDLNMTVSPANASDKKINWSVSGPAVVASTGPQTARVSFSGAEGNVEVTAKSNDVPRFLRTVRVKVARRVTDISLPFKSLYLTQIKPYQLPFTVYDGGDAVASDLSFASSNTRALTVTDKGKVLTKRVSKKTKATVTITSASGYKKSLTVYVVPKSKNLKSFKLSGLPKKLKKGQYKQLTLKPSSASATNLSPKFSSSKPSVITVDKSGRILAKAKGKARITVKIGGKKVRTKYISVS